MEYMFKGLFLVYIVSKLALSKVITYEEICILLIIVASIIARIRYFRSVYMIYVEAIMIIVGAIINPYFIIFFGISCYDMVAKRRYIEVGVLFVVAMKILGVNYSLDVMLIMGICSLLSYLNQSRKEKVELLKASFDKQRSYNYELETIKARLLNSAEDVARIAEIKERNRIAREIHDNIGHSIAGALMILQAAFKLRGRDDEKSGHLLDKAIKSLSESLTILKNTVNNIKPSEELGISYINKIIENFTYCKVELSTYGDLNKLEPSNLEIIGTNIKEALTNTSKYSNATLVNIALECNENYVRLQIRDNGEGCSNIKDSIGLSGMKDRIKNVGGSISINGDKGFIIVCILPLKREVADILEGTIS